MMFLPLVALSLSSAALVERPQASQDPAVAEQAAAADALITRYTKALDTRDFAGALATGKQIEAISDNPIGIALAQAMQASALYGLGRDAEAATLAAKADQAAPQEPLITRFLYYGGLATKRMDVVADALDRMIGRFPDVVRQFNRDPLMHFLRNEPKGQEKRNEDRRVALARLGYGGASADGYWFAKKGTDILVKRGDFAGAAELLPFIKDPQPLENMLILKRYSPLWPQLEKLAGPNLGTVRAAHIEAAQSAFEEAPDDNSKLADYANALRHGGRHADAAALRPKLASTSAELAAADEHMGWATNNVALALDESGRDAEADALFARLNDAESPEDYWRVNTRINRLELVAADGKFAKAAALLDVTEKSAEEDGTPYAQQLVRRLRYCIYSKMGRAEDAAKLMPELLKHADDATGATIDGLLCGGQVEKAEELALGALDDDDFVTGLIRTLQKQPLTSDDPSVWENGWKALRDRPAIRAVFDRLGRELPDHLRAPRPKRS